jgi:hypothetical protein
LFSPRCIAYSKTFRYEAPSFSDYSYHAVLSAAKSFRYEAPSFSDCFLSHCIAYGKITSQRSPVIFGLFSPRCIACGKSFSACVFLLNYEKVLRRTGAGVVVFL